MIKIIVLSVCLLVSLTMNYFLFMENKKYTSATPIAFEKASNDLTLVFEEPKVNNSLKRQKVSPISKKSKETFKVLENKENENEVVLSDNSEKKESKEVQTEKEIVKNVWISYGSFKTEHFLSESIKKVEELNFPYKVFQKKDLSNLRLGPFSKDEALIKLKNKNIPLDAFLIYE